MTVVRSARMKREPRQGPLASASVKVTVNSDESRTECHYDSRDQLIQKITIPAPGRVHDNLRRRRSHPTQQLNAVRESIRQAELAKKNQRRRNKRKNPKGT